MRGLSKPLVIVTLVLAVPILPFVLAGEWLESAFADGVSAAESPGWFLAGVVGVLAVDVFLPVPSSGIGTLAGARLGIVLGTAAVWLGMMLGAILGFAAARRWGRPIAERLAGPAELRRLEAPAHRFGSWLLLATRPLPILAEASVLLLGTAGLTWREFWWPVATANLVLAACYAVLGEVAAHRGWLAPAVVFALLVPILLAWLVRKRLIPAA